MNIENEIFKRLQKLKSERLAKKENLGAISDLIREEQMLFNDEAGKLKLFMDEMSELTTEIEDALRIIQPLAETFMSKFEEIRDMYNMFDDLLQRSDDLAEYGLETSSPDWEMVVDMFDSEVNRYEDTKISISGLI
jgi:hypothetical protein